MEKLTTFISLIVLFLNLLSTTDSYASSNPRRSPDLDRDFLHYEYDGVMFHYRINAQQTFAYLRDLDNWGSCYYYERIVVPDSLPYNGKNYPVQVIEYATFRGATILKELVLPATVISLGTTWNQPPEIYPFRIISDYTDYCSCPNLERITIAEDNPVMKDIDGVVYSKDGSILYYHPPKNSDTYVIPEGVTPANYAFACNESLKEVDIKNDLTTLPGGIFMKCHNLKDINIPSTVETIGGGSFRECTALEKIDLPKSLKIISDEAFFSINIKSIELPENVEEIGKSAFYNCSYLKEITLNDGLKTINSEAFSHTPLSSLKLPFSVQFLGWASLGIDNPDFELYVENPDPDNIYFQGSNYDPFNGKIGKHWKLYVPIGSKEKYADALFWEDFRKIKEWDPSSITYVRDEEILVYCQNQSIKIKGGINSPYISIFRLDGQCVFNDKVSSEADLTIDNLTPGVYFVKIENKTWKILL